MTGYQLRLKLIRLFVLTASTCAVPISGKTQQVHVSITTYIYHDPLLEMGKSKKRQRSHSRESDNESVTKKDLLKRMKRLERLLDEKVAPSRQSRSPGLRRARDDHSKRYRRRSRSLTPSRRLQARQTLDSSLERNRLDTHKILVASSSNKSPVRIAASLSPGESAASLSPRVSRLSPAHIPGTSIYSDWVDQITGSPTSTLTRSRTVIRSPDVSNWGQENQSLVLHEEVLLPDDLTSVLGEDIINKSPPAENLHDAIAVRWEHIITQGLCKETANTLLQRYTVAENCKQLSPPILNPEVETILSNDRAARDNFNMEIQTHIGKGLCAMGKAMTLLLNESENIPKKIRDEVLTPLGDSGRILTNLIHKVSITRRNLITPTLNKAVKELMEKTVPAEYLFGSDISERIKAAKSLQSTGKELGFNTAYVPQTQRGSVRRGGSQSHRPQPSRPHQVPSRVFQPLNRQRPARRQGDMKPKGQALKDPRRDRYRRKR